MEIFFSLAAKIGIFLGTANSAGKMTNNRFGGSNRIFCACIKSLKMQPDCNKVEKKTGSL
jgi:hypothetical protein